MLVCKTSSPEETFAFGKQLSQVLQAGDVVCLAGNLGAGKTLIAQAIAAGLGINDEVTSPTFTVMNVYDGEVPIYHFDLYRLEHPAELEDIGFAEYAANSSAGVAIIEWPDKFVEYLPEGYLWIEIKPGDSLAERVLFVRAQGVRHEKLCEELKQIAGSCFRYSHPCV